MMRNQLPTLLLLTLTSLGRGAQFPDERRLEELVANGDVLDRLHVKIALDTSADAANHSDGTATTATAAPTAPTTTAAATQGSEATAQRIYEELVECCSCVSYDRIFRPAGIYEAKHKVHGLNRWFVFDFEEDNSTTNTTTTTTTHTQAAIARLRSMVLDNGDPKDFRIEIATPEHAIAMAVLPESLASAKDVPMDVGGSNISPSSEENNLRGSLLAQPQTTTRTTPNDPLLSFQDHYDAIGLTSAWQLMTDNNAWDRCKNVTVHVLDTGWDTLHGDSGGTYMFHDDSEDMTSTLDFVLDGYLFCDNLTSIFLISLVPYITLLYSQSMDEPG